MAAPNIDKRVPAQGAGAPALLAETERIAAALEPQLREVIDTTMRRVAEVERQTLEQAREATVSTEQASHDALERSSRLVESLETLTGSVGEVTSRLQAEFDEVTRSLRGLREAQVRLPEDPVPARAAEVAVPEPPAEPEPASEPEAPPAAEEPAAPEPAEAAPEAAESDIEPSEELTEMFRDQITKMRDDGKSREEAERVLLRFRLGHRFMGMLDDIYRSAPPTRSARKRGIFRRRRA